MASVDPQQISHTVDSTSRSISRYKFECNTYLYKASGSKLLSAAPICFSLIADRANQRATTLPITRVVTRDLPISTRFAPTSFDLGSALLHLATNNG